MGTPYQAYAFSQTGGGGGATSALTPWIVAPEERAQNDRIFQSLGPAAVDGKITGNQARSYLISSGLPANILAQIWNLSDIDGDGKMTAQEFSIAMRLIQCRRQGIQLPSKLPPSMLASAPLPQASFSQQAQPIGMGQAYGVGPTSFYRPGAGGTLPGRAVMGSPNRLHRTTSFQQPKMMPTPMAATAGGAQSQAAAVIRQDVPWAVSAAAKMKYNQIFNANDRLRSGYLTGAQARNLLMQTGLNQDQLARIWNLSDIDNDGRLSNEEFAVAMYLVDDVKSGSALPNVLPTELVPPSLRRRKSSVAAQMQQPIQQVTSLASAAGDLLSSTKKGESAFPVHTRSYEDRRRENFERGQMELEKRKQERREKERKEKEEKERKMREEMERKEKEREEERRRAEERRLAELEEERQRELERIKLEEKRDYEAALQRHTAQREMELAREREWQNRRKEELESSKSKLASEVGSLKQKLRLLNAELETLTQKQTSMLSRIESNKVEMDEGRTVLRRLSQSRDSRTEELTRLQVELKNASERLSFLTEARERVAGDWKTRGFSSESLLSQSVRDECQGKRAAVIQLKVALQQQNEAIEAKKREETAHRLQLIELGTNEDKLSMEVEELKQVLESKKKEREEEAQLKAFEAKQRNEELKRQREEAERRRREQEEAIRREEEERRKRENEAKQKAAEQRQRILKEEEERQRREEEKQKQAEEARRRQRAATATTAKNGRRRSNGEAVAVSEMETRRAKSFSPTEDTLSVAQKVLMRRSELDEDAERRLKEFEERSAKAQSVRQRVEMLRKKKEQIQEARKRQEQEAAAKAAQEAQQRKENEEKRREAELQAERNRIAEKTERRQKAEETTAAAAAAAKRKALEEDEAKRKEIEARKQALLAKKEKILAEKRQQQQQQQQAAAATTAAARKDVNPISSPHYRALYDFTPRSQEELEFKENDIIIGVANSEDDLNAGWLTGKLKGRVGLVPVNYVTKVDLLASPATQRREFDLARASSPTQPTPLPRPTRQVSPLATTSFSDSIYAVPSSQLRRRETSPRIASLAQSDSERRFKTFSSAPTSPTSLSSPPPSLSLPNDDPDSGSSGPGSKRKQRQFERQESDHFRVVALYAWSGREADHLTFNKNDIITVLDQNDMWYKGALRGKEGWFPKSYVKLIGGRKAQSTPSLHEHAQVGTTITESEEAQETAAAPSLMPPEEYVAIYNYNGDEQDLSFKEGDIILVTKKDGEWWYGKMGSKEGTFPATYVKEKAKEGEAKGSKQVDIKTVSTGLKRPLIATVVAKYEAAGPEQLSLMPGQLVHVRKQNPNGWWEGELQARGKKKKGGWFPSNRVKLLSNPNETSAARRATDLRQPVQQQSSFSENQLPGTPTSTTSTASSASSTLPAPLPGDFRVLAVYSYAANNDDELSFTKGSVISVTNREGEWWTGELNGQVGVFPSNYVQPLSELHAPTTAKWSDTIEPLVLESLDDTERKRQEAIFELIQTEQSHCDALHLVKNLFYDPVSEKNILEPEVIQDIFVNWNELITCSDYFLKMLRVRQKTHEAEPIDCVGDILCEQVPRLTSFIRFCSRQMNAISVLQSKAAKKESFKELEAKVAQDSQTGGLPLSSFLLRPMQRVTRYPLLISKILEYTPEGHSDHGPLADAVKLAEDLCSQVNEGVRMQENLDRLEWLQTNVNLSSIEEKLVFNSQTNRMGQRRFLHSGNLKKARSGRELFAVLFNDFLMFMKPVTKLTAMFDSSDYKYEIYRKPVFLDQVQVKEAPAEQYGDDCYFHIGVDPEKVMTVRAENHTERNAWVKKIGLAVHQYKDKIRTKMRQERGAIDREKTRPSIGILTVILLEAANLQSADPNGKSDPFCEVRMGCQVHRTQTIEKSLNPKWNTKMIFYVKDVSKDRLRFTVFDRDLFSPSDYLGRTELPISELTRDGNRTSWGKWLVLKEVSTGELHVKLGLKLNSKAQSPN